MDFYKPHTIWMTFEGIIFIALGIVAFFLPWGFAVGMEIVLGILFIIAGTAQAYLALVTQKSSNFWLPLLGAVFLLITGIIMLSYPLSGILTITLLIILYFLFDGSVKMLLSFQMDGMNRWGWIFFSGLLEFILAVVLWSGWPSTAIWLIGTLVGISFLFQGIALLTIAAALRKL